MKKIEMIYNDLNLYWNIEWDKQNYKIEYGNKSSINKSITKKYNKNKVSKEINRKIFRGYILIDQTKSFTIDIKKDDDSFIFCNFESSKEIKNYINYFEKCYKILNEYNEFDNIKYFYNEDKTNNYNTLLKNVVKEDVNLDFNLLNNKEFNTIISLPHCKCTSINTDNAMCLKNNNKSIEVLVESLYTKPIRYSRTYSILKKAIKEKVLKEEEKILEIASMCYDSNFTDIYTKVGNIYEQLNNNKCIDYYKKSIEMNDEEGTYNLAVCLLEGKFIDVDYEEAYRLFKTMNEEETRVLYYLGYMMKNGYGCDINYDKAFEIFNNILEQRDYFEFIEYCFIELADMYMNGLGVEKDIQKAFYYYRTSIYNLDDIIVCNLKENSFDNLEKCKKEYEEILDLEKYFNFNFVNYNELDNAFISKEFCDIFNPDNKSIKIELVITMFNKLGFYKISDQLKEKLVDIVLVSSDYNDRYKILYILDTYYGYKLFESAVFTKDSINFLKNNNIVNFDLENIYNVINGFWYSDTFLPQDFLREVDNIEVVTIDNQLSISLDEISIDYVLDENSNKIIIDEEFLQNTYWVATDSLHFENHSICINKNYNNIYFYYDDIKREFYIKDNFIEFMDNKIYSGLTRFDKKVI